MSPVRGFLNEGDAWGYYMAHRKDCERPQEFTPGKWEVPNGSAKVTMVNPIKGVQTWKPTPQANDPGHYREAITGGKGEESGAHRSSDRTQQRQSLGVRPTPVPGTRR